jgi:hypothetical protein
MNLTGFWQFLPHVCDPVHFFVHVGESAVIMPKMLGIAMQNLVALVTICLELVHPC